LVGKDVFCLQSGAIQDEVCHPKAGRLS